jgi:hypothetical protein
MLKPTDKVSFGLMSELPGCNARLVSSCKKLPSNLGEEFVMVGTGSDPVAAGLPRIGSYSSNGPESARCPGVFAKTAYILRMFARRLVKSSDADVRRDCSGHWRS